MAEEPEGENEEKDEEAESDIAQSIQLVVNRCAKETNDLGDGLDSRADLTIHAELQLVAL